MENDCNKKELIKIKRLQIDMPKTLDPAYATDTISREVIDCTYDRLFIHEGDRCKEFLVRKMWRNDDTEYFCELKDNLRFRDGSYCTSNDVKLSLQRMLHLSKKAKALFFNIFNEDSIECVNDNIIKFKLVNPCYELKELLAISEASIINLKTISDDVLLKYNTFGTGPFYVKEYNNEKKTVHLVSNDYYWNDGPYLDEILIMVNHNYEFLIKEFLYGNADIMCAQASRADMFIDNDNIEVRTFPSLDISLFVINQSKEYLSNPDIRSMIKKCFDYERFLYEGKKGMGVRLNTAVPFGVRAHNENIGKNILKVNDINNNLLGNKRIINKMPCLKILSILGLEDADFACEILSECLKRIGIKCEIVKKEFQDFCNDFDSGVFDISFMAWAPDIIDPYGYIYDFYHSQGEITSAIGYKNIELDLEIMEGRTKGNLKVQEECYKKIQEIGEKENMYLWLFQGLNLKVYKKRLKGIKHNILDGDYCLRTIAVKDGITCDEQS